MLVHRRVSSRQASAQTDISGTEPETGILLTELMFCQIHNLNYYLYKTPKLGRRQRSGFDTFKYHT